MEKSIRVLLVDDEDEFREVTSKVLARRGFQVRQAEGGETALQLLTEAPSDFDVVLLDVKMQGMDGISTLKALRSSGLEVPVIILTGHGGYEDAVAGIRLGIVDFLQKPVDVEQLGQLIRKLLAGQRGLPLRERTVVELMVPAGSYLRVREDDPISVAVKALQESFFHYVSGKVSEQGHRTVLVYDAQERFVGLIRIADVVQVSIPAFLRDSPYASYFTGMFLAQCKTLGGLRVGDVIRHRHTIGPDTPLMEAVQLMVSSGMINLPVMDGPELLGILRDKDILLEIAQHLGLD